MRQRLAGNRLDGPAAPKPKVYFEEWDDPLISGIGWVSELIEIAGGEDVLPHLRAATGREGTGSFRPKSTVPRCAS